MINLISAILIGIILGFPLTIAWLFISFIVGGVFSAVLLLTKNAKIKDKIAFGPFLVVGMLIIMFFGKIILSSFYPYL